ncbi:MAG: GNAT family N-acetyltransferase [Parabacteroides sp.]
MSRIESLKALWRECFEDDEAFIRFFFERIYRESDVLTDEEGGKLYAALYLLPRMLTWNGRLLPVAYLYGVGTAREARGQGRMSHLIRRALEEVRARGMAAVVTVPANAGLYDFYGHFGFVTTFYRTLRTVELEEWSPAADWTCGQETGESCASLYSYFRQQMLQREGCIQHDEETFQVICADLWQSGGALWSARDREGKLSGLLFLYPDESGWLVKELVADQEAVSRQLLQTLLRHYGASRLTWAAPAEGTQESLPYGMACWLDSTQAASGKRGYMSLMLD